MPEQPISAAATTRTTALAEHLEAGIERLQLPVETSAVTGLIDYILLLERWNRIWNLTAVRDPQSMLERHLLDSLSILPFLHGNRFLDVGTGAGLPGIPLALTRPASRVHMVDSNAKKTRFVQQAIASLRLTNASVEQARVEQLQPAHLEQALEGPVDTLVSRAFSAPVDIISRCRHLCAPGSRILFMLGTLDQQLATLPDAIELEGIHRVDGLHREQGVATPPSAGSADPGSDSLQRHIAVCRLH